MLYYIMHHLAYFWPLAKKCFSEQSGKLTLHGMRPHTILMDALADLN